MWTELLAFVASHLLYFALHLEKNNTFPKPLSAAQEQECFERLEQGDEKAREKLIEHNLRLVAHIVKKYASGQDVYKRQHSNEPLNRGIFIEGFKPIWSKHSSR